MLLQTHEVITLIVILAGYLAVFFSYKKHAQLKLLYLGYTALAIGAIATNLKNIVLPAELNFIQHAIGVFVAGLVFAHWAHDHYTQDQFLRKKLEEMSK